MPMTARELIVAADLAAADEARRGLREALPRHEVAERRCVHGVGVRVPGIAATD